eukprot:TRINITY_DN455_c0_g1_i4.p3 TRINITY_DN455_c0_g1~~TRINITY_DN455_c0_g1_i4.p3  ORF type:complete len:139 (-),score=10.13 TRINITY_DN455_c0_g1_i4:466-882(-)
MSNITPNNEETQIPNNNNPDVNEEGQAQEEAHEKINESDPKLRFYEELIKARAHMGYQESTFMSTLLGQRSTLSVFDLDKTLISLYRALHIIKQTFDARQQILIVNTNPEFQPLVKYTIKKIKEIRNVKIIQDGSTQN